MEEDAHTLCRLEVLGLEREIRILQDKIHMLEGALYGMWVHEVLPSMHHEHGRTLAQDVRDKWSYYHEHKERVCQDLCKKHGMENDQISWVYVKKETDRLWSEEQGS